MVMCQCRSVDFKKGTLLVGDVDHEGDYACEEVGDYGKFLYLPLNLAMHLNCSKLKF